MTPTSGAQTECKHVTWPVTIGKEPVMRSRGDSSPATCARCSRNPDLSEPLWLLQCGPGDSFITAIATGLGWRWKVGGSLPRPQCFVVYENVGLVSPLPRLELSNLTHMRQTVSVCTDLVRPPRASSDQRKRKLTSTASRRQWSSALPNMAHQSETWVVDLCGRELPNPHY